MICKRFFLAAVFILAAFTSLHAQKPAFQYGPWVTDVLETGFTVVWTTSEKTFCRVEVAPDDGTPWGLKNRQGFYQVISGRRQAGTFHSVEVSGLEPGRSYRYKVYGKVVADDRDAYGIDYGPEFMMKCEGNPSVKTMNRNAQGCRFFMLNDIHGNDGRYRSLTKDVIVDSMDFFVMNGDMVSYITDEESLHRHVFDVVKGIVSRLPVVYARGNHETRGRDAHLFARNCPTSTGEPYYMFRQGPVAFLVLDAGEDKPDMSPEYSGYADFDSYRQTQLEWLKSVVKDPLFTEALLKVVLMHIPAISNKKSWYGQKWVGDNFVPVLNAAGVDLMLSGHHHEHMYMETGSCGNGFPIIANDDTDRLEFTADADGYKVVTYDQEGNAGHVYEMKTSRH